MPSSVRFGGRHRVQVHTLAGGRRIVERLGPNDSEIEFKGIFSGANAERRSRALDSLRISGEIVWLTWESFRQKVIVNSFIADYHNPWWISFRVNCLVVHQSEDSLSAATDLATAVSSDLASAISALGNTAISLTSMQNALAQPNVLTIRTAACASAIGIADGVIQAIQAGLAEQSIFLTSPFPTGAAVTDIARHYVEVVDCAGVVAAEIIGQSYVGRIQANLGGSSG